MDVQPVPLSAVAQSQCECMRDRLDSAIAVTERALKLDLIIFQIWMYAIPLICGALGHSSALLAAV